MLVNGTFENADAGWTEVNTSHSAIIDTELPHTGARSAWLGGTDQEPVQYIYQDVRIPANATNISLAYYRLIHPETKGIMGFLANEAKFSAQIANPNGDIVGAIEEIYSSAGDVEWDQVQFDLSQLAGKSIRLVFSSENPRNNVSSFFVDNVELIACTTASLLAICPGFQFRSHYFITLLPALALLIGAGAASLAGLLETRMSRDSARALVAAAGLVLVGWYLHQERGYLFAWSPRDLSRLTYGRNPFLESPEIARYLREHTAPDARIAVIGSEPQIYFYAQRRSATGYLYTYPLVEIQRYASTMQEEMIREIETAQPAYVVFVKIKSSWIIRKDSDRRVLRWAASYLEGCYDMVGIADIHAPDATAWVWDGEVPGYHPRSVNLVLVYRRKSEAPCAAAPTR